MKSIYILIFTMLASLPALTQFSQTPLPYAYDALEPVIDAPTMDIHYNRHHAGYVNNLNKAVNGTALAEMSLEEILSGISAYDMAVRNNAGGHYNHELFWEVLSPVENTLPSKELQGAIATYFGDMDGLRETLLAEASRRFGSGWAWLYVNAQGDLAVCSTPNQDNPLMDIAGCKGIPILGIDVWEHAYYLHYQNKRGEYLNNIWNIINWEEVSRNYREAISKIQ